jgi:hypothetical protein
MTGTINFNNELHRRCKKVHDAPADAHLPFEGNAQLPSTDGLPQLRFRRSWLMPHRVSAFGE